MDLGLSDKTALITGGDSGIGFQTARILLDEGARVILTDQDQDSLDKAVAELGHPDRVSAFPADLSMLDGCTTAAEALRNRTDRLDLLVHCAGITGETGDFLEVSDQGWVDTIAINLLGPIRLTRELLPLLRSSGAGRLVFTVSEDAVQPYDDELPYCAAKAGLLSFAKGLSRSYADDGLLVNCVSPAFIETPMTDAMMEKRADEKGTSVDEAVESFLTEERPFMELGRRGRPEEVAAVIAFLCSQQASFVNGSNYRVDSGSVATI